MHFGKMRSAVACSSYQIAKGSKYLLGFATMIADILLIHLVPKCSRSAKPAVGDSVYGTL
jgi:hypothetical protein